MLRMYSLTLICLAARLICPGVTANSDRKCSFPAEWRGRYYQTGLGDIFIRDNFITTKGTCIEQNNRDYFLFHNRESQCYHCLLIMRQHKNIIQYKESYCTNTANMTVVCNQIRVETTLYTMVKEPVLKSVKCPFHDSFNFTYNDMASDFCTRMESYARPCVSQSRYQLLFRHCTTAAMYNDKEFHLECLATWKDGSEMYLYGRLSGEGLVTKDDKYRCFKYHYYGNEVSMAMSADTSCRGLRSASDGPFLMKFSKDVLGSRTSSSCHFPDWLVGVTWRSLDGKHEYTLDSESETFSEFFRSSNGHLQRINEFQCSHDFNESPTGDEITLVSYTSHKCSSSHQCIRIKRSANRMIDFSQGPWMEFSGTFERCRANVYEDSRPLIGLAEEEALSPCPRPGIYHVAPSDACSRRLEVGCQNSSVINVLTRCHQDQISTVSVECLVSWNHESKTRVIFREKGSSVFNCFSFSRDLSNVEWLGVDLLCSRNQTTPPTGFEHPFRLQRQDACKEKEKLAADRDLEGTQRFPIFLPTVRPDKELNLYADGVQPRRRSKFPSIPDEDDEDGDEIFSGNDEAGADEDVLEHDSQRAPPERYPVTWRRPFPVSTPPTVFQISSSSRRVNSAKLGPKGVSVSDHRGRENIEGQGQDRTQRGQEKVTDFDEDSCSRHKVTPIMVLLVVVTSLLCTN